MCSLFQADGIYDNPLDLLDIKPEFSDEETLNDSKTEPKVNNGVIKMRILKFLDCNLA